MRVCRLAGSVGGPATGKSLGAPPPPVPAAPAASCTAPQGPTLASVGAGTLGFRVCMHPNEIVWCMQLCGWWVTWTVEGLSVSWPTSSIRWMPPLPFPRAGLPSTRPLSGQPPWTTVV
jgi:hypothetical protein